MNDKSTHVYGDLLTTTELQDLLKVDRTTIYRMMKNGRITGTRVGKHWRFSRNEIEALLSKPTPPEKNAHPRSHEILPLHCVQPIQQLFAEIAGTGALTTALDGEPLTEVSNSCSFCSLILQSDSGRKACRASWRTVAQQSGNKPQFMACHAGLQCLGAPVEIDGHCTAVVVACQFYAHPANSQEEVERINRLASSYDIAVSDLIDAARTIHILGERNIEEIAQWLERVAYAFEQIGSERAALMNRLQRIAEMSTLNTIE